MITWRLRYWIRPYDMLLDARRWRWQKSGHARQAAFLQAHPEILEGAKTLGPPHTLPRGGPS